MPSLRVMLFIVYDSMTVSTDGVALLNLSHDSLEGISVADEMRDLKIVILQSLAIDVVKINRPGSFRAFESAS